MADDKAVSGNNSEWSSIIQVGLTRSERTQMYREISAEDGLNLNDMSRLNFQKNEQNRLKHEELLRANREKIEQTNLDRNNGKVIDKEKLEKERLERSEGIKAFSKEMKADVLGRNEGIKSYKQIAKQDKSDRKELAAIISDEKKKSPSLSDEKIENNLLEKDENREIIGRISKAKKIRADLSSSRNLSSGLKEVINQVGSLADSARKKSQESEAEGRRSKIVNTKDIKVDKRVSIEEDEIKNNLKDVVSKDSQQFEAKQQKVDKDWEGRISNKDKYLKEEVETTVADDVNSIESVIDRRKLRHEEIDKRELIEPGEIQRNLKHRVVQDSKSFEEGNQKVNKEWEDRASLKAKALEDEENIKRYKASNELNSKSGIEKDQLFDSGRDLNSKGKSLVPDSVKSKYIRVDNKYYFKGEGEKIAFVDKGFKLETKLNNKAINESFIATAKNSGWSEIRVKGSESFRKSVWQKASAQGIVVTGFQPTKKEVAELEDKGIDVPKRGESLKSTKEPLSKNEQAAKDFEDMSHEEAVKKHPKLAPYIASVVAIEKKMDADQLSPEDRNIVIKRMKKNLINSIEKGAIPTAKIKETSRLSGKLVDHGSAPYQNDKNNADNYYIKIKSKGNEKTLWGIDLERALTESKVSKGQKIELVNQGKKSVSVDSPIIENGVKVGTEKINTHRNKWDIKVVEKTKTKQVEKELSR